MSVVKQFAIATKNNKEIHEAYKLIDNLNIEENINTFYEGCLIHGTMAKRVVTKKIF